jgi:hypothetical protein
MTYVMVIRWSPPWRSVAGNPIEFGPGEENRSNPFRRAGHREEAD